MNDGNFNKSHAYRVILDAFRQMYGNAQIMALADYTSTDLILTIPGVDIKFTFKNLPVTGIERGDMLYVDAGNDWVVLHHGNAGDVLFSGGHGASPSWNGISSIDHGGLGGLTDNDHPQYQLRCGVSARTATLSYSSGVFYATYVSDYDVWTNGVKWTITNTRQVSLDSDNTLYYVYFDVDGVLKASTGAWDITGNAAPFALVYRVSSSLAAIGDERHVMDRNRALHKMMHDTIGSRYDNLRGGLTGTFGATTFSITDGYIWDEDLEHHISGTQTTCRRWSRNSGGTSMTFVDGCTTLYLLNGTNIQYDNAPLADAGNNKYVCHYVFATNDITVPIYCLVGQAQHDTLAQAQNETTPTFAGLSTVEWKLLYKVIYRNTGSPPTYVATLDYRNVSGVPVSFAPTAHASLTGLSADDHPQYLLVTNIDDVPVDGEIAQPISSNWAYDHAALDATAVQKGHATATQITKLDGIEAGAVALSTVKSDADIASAISLKHSNASDHTQGTDTTLGTLAADINMNSHQLSSLSVPDANGEAIRATTKITEVNLESAVDLKHSNASDHTQGTDTALGAVGTKNPPIDADKVLYRNSESSDALVTSTWAQIKAFLKTYFDTLYNLYVHPNHSGDVTSVADGATTISAKAVDIAMLADGTDGELITWGADGVATTVAAGSSGQVLTSNGAGAAPTFQDATGGGGGATKDIHQHSHGFAVGDVVYLNGTTYTKAKADAESTAEAVGIVSAVAAGTDDFTLLNVGYVSGMSGLTAGTVYFLSPTTAGALTATEPTTVGHISKPLLIADSTTSGYFFNMRGSEVGASGETTDDITRDNLMVLAWKLAIAEGLSIFKLEDGIVDEFEDETGVDTTNSTNESYNSTDDYYSPSSGITVDMMEYATNSAAQAAYVTNDSGVEYGGTIASQSSNGGNGYTLINEDSSYRIGKSGVITQIKYYTSSASENIKAKVFRISGTNYVLVGESETWSTSSGGATRTLTNPITGVESGDIVGFYTAAILGNIYTSSGKSGLNYIAGDQGGTSAISSWTDVSAGMVAVSAVVLSTQSFSESTIKTQGTYSLKGVASTDALNKTLTRTVNPTIDLSGVDTLTFSIRSSRTGSNIKIGIHDSGGTTSEKTHSVSSANTWETCTWDISGVSDANKDAIDSIVVTITNADAANTFYIDDFSGPLNNMTLISEPVEAEVEPSEARFLALVEPVDSITLNTDLKGYVTIDDGANWEQVTLTDEGYFDSAKKIYAGNETLTSRSDKTVRLKLTTHNNKNLKVHGWGMLWR